VFGGLAGFHYLLRFTVLDYEVRQQFSQQARAIEKLARELGALLDERSHEKDAATMDKVRELVITLYGQTSAYTNLVLAAGYAGSFALWQFMEKFISVRARFTSALLLTISLALFVGYELQKMVKESWKMRHLADAIIRIPEARRFEVVQAILMHRQIREARVWAVFVIPTAATGLAAASLLVAVFVAKLFGYVLLP
jgi:hypothetical protein